MWSKSRGHFFAKAPRCSLGCCSVFNSLASEISRGSELSVAFCEPSVSVLINSGREYPMWQTPGDEQDLL